MCFINFWKFWSFSLQIFVLPQFSLSSSWTPVAFIYTVWFVFPTAFWCCEIFRSLFFSSLCFNFVIFLLIFFFFFFKFPGLFFFFVQFIIELLLYFRFFLGLKFPLDSSSEFLSLMKFSIVLPVMFILSTNFSKCL